MFDRLTTLPHGLRVFVEAILYGLQHILMLPARDAPLHAGGAALLERTVATRICPIASQLLPAIDPLNEAPYLIPPQIAAESYSANQIIQCVFTQRRSKPAMLRTSKCFPVCPRLRTFSHNSFKCHWCSVRQLFASAAIATSRVAS